MTPKNDVFFPFGFITALPRPKSPNFTLPSLVRNIFLFFKIENEKIVWFEVQQKILIDYSRIRGFDITMNYFVFVEQLESTQRLEQPIEDCLLGKCLVSHFLNSNTFCQITILVVLDFFKKFKMNQAQFVNYMGFINKL